LRRCERPTCEFEVLPKLLKADPFQRGGILPPLGRCRNLVSPRHSRDVIHSGGLMRAEAG
jgi:hypothetical protein